VIGIKKNLSHVRKKPTIGYIIFSVYKNQKFEDFRFENGENTRLRLTDG
jgi:hypothetical protein